MDTIRVPHVYLQLGDKREGLHPVYFCESGDNSGAVIVAAVRDTAIAYEIMCAACEAYNAARNADESP